MSKNRKSSSIIRLIGMACLALVLAACSQSAAEVGEEGIFKIPLITKIYTADPSAHVFEGKLYVYVSHDLKHFSAETSEGDQYDMEDYHVLAFADMESFPEDLGEILHVEDVPWAERQMWAPDAAFKDDIYYLYFPAKGPDGIFHIGVATSSTPEGPFIAEDEAIPGSYSMDPAVFVDNDGQAYMYFGGLMGGQLEKWESGTYDKAGLGPGIGENAMGPRVAKLTADMLGFDGPVGEVVILDEDSQPLLTDDYDRRFFEGAWMHKYNGTYYLSYSTGGTHYIAYATGDNPLGPFVFRGYILTPVMGWTTHASIVEFQGKWYLFYHDSSLSGIDYKRCVKVAELSYNEDGSIQTIDP